MVFTNATQFPYTPTPLTNITPFTYRDGMTFLEKLEAMRVWLNDTLVFEFNAGIENAIAEMQDAMQVVNNKTGQAEIQRYDVAGPYTLEIDPVWPDNHMVNVVLKQNIVGGWPVTWGEGINGDGVDIDPMPNTETDFWLVPEGDGTWTAITFIKGQELITAVDTINAALALKANASSLATTNTNVTNLTTEVGTKASQADLTTLTTTVGTKASQADLTTTNTNVTGLTNTKADKSTAVSAGHPLRVVLGVIRNTGTGWEVIDDAGHTPVGIDDVLTTDAYIEVDYGSLGVIEVGSFVAVPDDTLAQAGFFAGSSVQLDKAIIKIGQSGKAFSDFISFNGSDWVSTNGTITPTFSGGELTLTHPAILDEGNLSVTLAPRMGATKAYRTVISGATGAVQATSVRIQFRDENDALVAVPDTNMKVYVSHGGGTRSVDPTTLTTASYPNSNIWLMGMMKVA